jgi:hypothetical protein
MVMESSPPPFIVFRNPKANAASIERVDVYQLALDFTAKIELILRKVEARFHLKDRLDRNATGIAIHVGQAANDLAPSGRRRSYRLAHALAVDCSTILDIIARRTDVDRNVVDLAQKLVAQLLSKLEHLRNQSV